MTDAWYAEEPTRWTAMEHIINGSKFQAKFRYEPIDYEEDSLERRRRIILAHFGEKPVLYPPLPDGLRRLEESDLVFNRDDDETE